MNSLNKRKVSGSNNYPKKGNLVESKDLERSLAQEIAKEFTKPKSKKKWKLGIDHTSIPFLFFIGEVI